MATCLAEGGSSVATTVPASDADAVENAKRGCAQAKELEATAPTAAAPSTTARPSLCRVNSVPVLESPHTPADRIRRTSTPTAPADPPQSGTGAHEASVTPEESQNGTSPVPEGGATKPKKVVNKKKKKRAKNAQAQDDHKPAPSNEGNQPAANKEASTTYKTEPVSDGNPPQTLDKTTIPSDKTTDDSARALAPSAGAPQPKPAATKSMARKPDHGEPVKVERTPARTDSLDDLQREQAKANNLRRANTDAQHTPAEGEADRDDLEQLLDKEIKQEHPTGADPPAAAGELASMVAPAPPPAAQLAEAATAPPTETPALPPAGTPAPPTPPRRVSFAPQPIIHEPQEEEAPKKKKREKTEAEKAAHARYMRFSRSFKRILHQSRTQFDRWKSCSNYPSHYWVKC